MRSTAQTSPGSGALPCASGDTVAGPYHISATLSVYLDLYNVFQALLSLLGFAGSRD